MFLGIFPLRVEGGHSDMKAAWYPHLPIGLVMPSDRQTTTSPARRPRSCGAATWRTVSQNSGRRPLSKDGRQVGPEAEDTCGRHLADGSRHGAGLIWAGATSEMPRRPFLQAAHSRLENAIEEFHGVLQGKKAAVHEVIQLIWRRMTPRASGFPEEELRVFRSRPGSPTPHLAQSCNDNMAADPMITPIRSNQANIRSNLAHLSRQWRSPIVSPAVPIFPRRGWSPFVGMARPGLPWELERGSATIAILARLEARQ